MVVMQMRDDDFGDCRGGQPGFAQRALDGPHDVATAGRTAAALRP